MSTLTSSRKSLLRLAAVALAAVIAATTLHSRPAEAASGKQTIVATAAETGQFSTLLSLAKKAGLVEALSGSGPLTLFAPTDAAFKAIPKATLTSLANDKAALRRVLLYHVLKGNIPASRVMTLTSAKTLAGPAFQIRANGSSVVLNRSAKVIKTDIGASNGTIHVINKVLLPPAN